MQMSELSCVLTCGESIENAICNVREGLQAHRGEICGCNIRQADRNLLNVRASLSVGYILHTCDINKEDVVYPSISQTLS